MWILPTRGRPELAQKLIDACVKTGMTTPCIMFIDGTEEDYREVKIPPFWGKMWSKENIGPAAIQNWLFDNFPNEPWYGWLADDFLPATDGWDVALSKAAEDRYITYCPDGNMKPESMPDWITSAFCIGGGVVRAAGWFAPRCLWQAGPDQAWSIIGRNYKLLRWLEDVQVTHVHWQWGQHRRKRDWVDNDGDKEIENVGVFLRSDEFAAALRAIKEYVDTPNVQPA